MTVTSPVARNDYTGAGSAGPFVYGFRIYLATDLVVTTQDPSGNVVTVAYPGGYTVTGVGSRSGGTITLTTALAVGWKMTIQRVRPLTQLINYRNQGAGFPANIEDGFDQLVMIAQQLQSELGQAITVPITTGPGSTVASFLPSYYLRVNLAGTGVEGVTQVVAAQNFLQSGIGAVVRSANSKMAEQFSVKDFGATGNGVTDDTAAIQAAVTALSAAGGGFLRFPSGTYKITSTVTIASNQMRLSGDIFGETTILFMPSVGSPCFLFSNGAGSVIDCGLTEMSFTSTNTTTFKAMVRVIDGRQFTAQRIQSTDGNWTGNNSYGLDIRGRDGIRIRNCDIYADLPIVFNLNPNVATNSLDHTTVEECFLTVNAGQAHAAISFAAGSIVTRFSVRDCAFVRGNSSITLSSPGAGLCVGIAIENCRSEQGIAGTTYSYNFAGGANEIQFLTIKNCQLDNAMNGVSLADVRSAMLDTVYYTQPGGTAYNFGASCTMVTMVGCYYEVGSALVGDSGVNGLVMLNCQNGSANPVFSRVGGAGTTIGLYGATAIARAVLATGAGHSVDDVITALQNLGAVKQS